MNRQDAGICRDGIRRVGNYGQAVIGGGSRERQRAAGHASITAQHQRVVAVERLQLKNRVAIEDAGEGPGGGQPKTLGRQTSLIKSVAFTGRNSERHGSIRRSSRVAFNHHVTVKTNDGNGRHVGGRRTADGVDGSRSGSGGLGKNQMRKRLVGGPQQRSKIDSGLIKPGIRRPAIGISAIEVYAVHALKREAGVIEPIGSIEGCSQAAAVRELKGNVRRAAAAARVGQNGDGIKHRGRGQGERAGGNAGVTAHHERVIVGVRLKLKDRCAVEGAHEQSRGRQTISFAGQPVLIKGGAFTGIEFRRHGGKGRAGGVGFDNHVQVKTVDDDRRHVRGAVRNRCQA